ncbi:hypothetical protein C8R47DRAFT_1078677 [Mycena vitilis]|nr:hypothetical protein C8R47DRAFT_1078677 [Mycena vitilis]
MSLQTFSVNVVAGDCDATPCNMLLAKLGPTLRNLQVVEHQTGSIPRPAKLHLHLTLQLRQPRRYGRGVDPTASPGCVAHTRDAISTCALHGDTCSEEIDQILTGHAFPNLQRFVVRLLSLLPVHIADGDRLLTLSASETAISSKVVQLLRRVTPVPEALASKPGRRDLLWPGWQCRRGLLNDTCGCPFDSKFLANISQPFRDCVAQATERESVCHSAVPAALPTGCVASNFPGAQNIPNVSTIFLDVECTTYNRLVVISRVRPVCGKASHKTELNTATRKPHRGHLATITNQVELASQKISVIWCTLAESSIDLTYQTGHAKPCEQPSSFYSARLGISYLVHHRHRPHSQVNSTVAPANGTCGCPFNSLFNAGSTKQAEWRTIMWCQREVGQNIIAVRGPWFWHDSWFNIEVLDLFEVSERAF